MKSKIFFSPNVRAKCLARETKGLYRMPRFGWTPLKGLSLQGYIEAKMLSSSSEGGLIGVKPGERFREKVYPRNMFSQIEI